MGYGKWITFLFHIFIHLIGLPIAQPEVNNHWCINSNNYTSNSTYERNLEAVLTAVATNTNINYGFYNFSVGESPDNTANAIALCRGDYLNLCRSCVNDATHKLRRVCPNQKEAFGWYDYCMLRYSNRSIFGSMETWPAFIGWRLQNYSDVDQFYALQRRLLCSLRDEAARGDSQRKFATGTVAAPNFETIYGLVQCTPDLYEYQCIECLQSCMNDLPYGYSGGGVSKPSCTLRHELYPFFNETVTYAQPPADAPPPPPLAPLPADAPPRRLSGKDLNTTQIVIIIIASIVICLILCICIFIKKMNPRKSKEKYETMDETNSTVESLQFDFNTTRVATNNFSDSNKLGEGGFGVVYKGRLQNGQEIAVKRLSKNSRQGELEFKNEVLLMFKLQHRGLVRLLGFCLEGTERLLIYEFVPNASLDHFLFDVVKCAYLDWKKRYSIIEGVARGLLYLHEDSRLRIIHRDLKASNILLDADMNPKISDFGMARLFAPDESQHKTRRIVGTYGYMAPEYAKHGQFSVKSDVFSFGVLVLEIVSGKKNCFRNGENMEDLRSYAWRNWRKGRVSKVIDPRLRVHGSGSIRNIMRCIHIGLLCVQENAADRPTMASVILMLDSFSLTLPLPSAPAFYVHSSIGPEIRIVRDSNSGPNESNQSINEVSITELYPR